MQNRTVWVIGLAGILCVFFGGQMLEGGMKFARLVQGHIFMVDGHVPVTEDPCCCEPSPSPSFCLSPCPSPSLSPSPSPSVSPSPSNPFPGAGWYHFNFYVDGGQYHQDDDPPDFCANLGLGGDPCFYFGSESDWATWGEEQGFGTCVVYLEEPTEFGWIAWQAERYDLIGGPYASQEECGGL